MVFAGFKCSCYYQDHNISTMHKTDWGFIRPRLLAYFINNKVDRYISSKNEKQTPSKILIN